MLKRMARLGVLLAGVTGLLASATPPAQADSVGSVVFVIDATVNGGTHTTIAYPCIQGLPNATGVPNVNTAHLCIGTLIPPQTATKSKKGSKPGLPAAANTQVNLVNNHNPSTVGIANVACVAAAVNVNKLSKSAVEAGQCAIGGGGTVSGHCGLSTGQVTGTIGPGPAILSIPPIQTVSFSVKFTGVATILNLNGSVSKGSQTGWVKGIAFALPPNNAGGGQLGQGSCLDLNPLRFRVVGAVAVLLT